MRFTVQIDSDNGHHCRMTLFVNGDNAGRLCMTSEEADRFRQVLLDGAWGVTVTRVEQVKEQPIGHGGVLPSGPDVVSFGTHREKSKE